MRKEGWVYPIDPYGRFHWCFRYWIGRRTVDDKELLDEKELQLDVKANYVKWSKLLMADLVIILPTLKLDKFCCTGVMN